MMLPAKSILTVIVCLAFASVQAGESPEQFWRSKVDPLLDRYCLKCHAGVRQKSGLDLRSIETILRGGDSGPAMIPGKPEQSRLLQMVLPHSDPHMPPEGKKQLSQQEIDLLQQGISLFPKPKELNGSTNTSWVVPYLEERRVAQKPRFVPSFKTSANEAIDQILSSSWREHKITPNRFIDEAAFARRVYLDLIGRIPTLGEVNEYLNDQGAEARSRLIDKLLESPEYARHMRQVFDVILMGRARKNETARRENGWHDFLENSFRQNQPWNETVRQFIVARGTNGVERGASWYLYERRNNHQAMAEAIAPVVFGVQIGCAQCHNHPLAWEVEQRHYWGLVAAFNRSQGVKTSSGIGIAESATGGFIQFANLKKQSQPAELAFLNGKVVPEAPEKENPGDVSDLYLVPPPKEGDKKTIVTVPKFSRREALAQAVTVDNPLLARSFVNRMWANLMGRGIVHPVDEIDSRHPPSQPVLLDWLARDFEKNGYNVERLVRNIVLSKAYRLKSVVPQGRFIAPESFARALEKPLSAEQLHESLLIATGNREVDEKGFTRGSDELSRELTKKFPDFLPVVYNPSLEQAMFFSNSKLIDDLLKPKEGNTADQLLRLDTATKRIELAYRIVLGRSPDREELKKCTELLKSRTPEKGVRNLLWSLIAGTEFQVNH